MIDAVDRIAVTCGTKQLGSGVEAHRALTAVHSIDCQARGMVEWREEQSLGQGCKV
jgi:hypothetical protein